MVLGILLKEFNGRVDVAVAAYNGGRGNVKTGYTIRPGQGIIMIVTKFPFQKPGSFI